MITGCSYDPNSENKLTENAHISSLSLSQLIHLTQFVKEEIPKSHISAQETSLSIYVAFLLHSQTRSRLLVTSSII